MKSAVFVAALNALVLQAVTPGTAFNQPLANLVAILSTLVGVYAATKLLNLRKSQETHIPRRKIVLSSTALGIISRLAIMLPFLYIVASLVGMSLVIAILPLFAIYDLIVALYSVPLGYLIASMVNRYVKLNSKI
jgi:ABC-type multidrug transport system permease subunit